MDLSKKVWISNREKEVLKMLLEEKKAHEIGRELGLDEKTISTYKLRLLTKTNSKTIIGLYRFNLFNGIVEIEYPDVPVCEIRLAKEK